MSMFWKNLLYPYQSIKNYLSWLQYNRDLHLDLDFDFDLNMKIKEWMTKKKFFFCKSNIVQVSRKKDCCEEEKDLLKKKKWMEMIFESMTRYYRFPYFQYF